MKLIKKIIFKGEIELLTGLHIGGSKSTMSIGGMDSPVIKTPHGVPYIPGSSLKGKLRSLLAKTDKTYSIEGWKDVDDDPILIRQMFGSSNINKKKKDDFVHSGPTRLIFRDAFLDVAAFEAFKKNADMEEDYTEAKFENSISRTSGKAANPRQIERVPAGAVFDFEIVMDVYEGDDASEFEKKLIEGFDLLQNDYLGGSGTRGYGKVKITLHPKNEAKINADSHS